MKTLFITGTNTEVGKTHVAAMLARSLVERGTRVGIYKPVASGCRKKDGELIADDAVALWEAAGRPSTLEQVCPQRFTAPVSPPTSAALEGKSVDARLLRTGLDYWRENYEVTLVEGAGGLMSPLSEEDFNIDLARELGGPIIIVAANRLGVINATLQTIITAKTQAAECPIAGVVLNQVTPNENDASLATNAIELAGQLRSVGNVTLLASVGFGEERFAEPIDWGSLLVRNQ
ncbi:dethiobiotin synthase [Adhaeretor mobilis]|nr:dethiobiotin synthase [Adhaeretor mobilis]